MKMACQYSFIFKRFSQVCSFFTGCLKVSCICSGVILEIPRINIYYNSNSADEWENFLQRVGCQNEDDLKGTPELEEELRLWASYRGQTLTKTGSSFYFFIPFLF